MLNSIRQRKKRIRREQLERQEKNNTGLDYDSLKKKMEQIGIKPGSTLLVHSSLSSLGHVKGGAKTVVNVLIDILGEDGNLLMPSSSNTKLQLDFIQENSVYNLDTSPSKMGAISEYFRNYPGVLRSFHPTEPVCVLGKKAKYLTEGHMNELTPYTSKSPFYRITEMEGKILYLGVTLDNAGTSLHLLEDNTNFEYPVYHRDIFDVTLKTGNEVHRIKTKVHNPEYSKKRKCDELIPRFKEKGVCAEYTIGEASCLLFDARSMFELMVEDYKKFGITMYTPKGK